VDQEQKSFKPIYFLTDQTTPGFDIDNEEGKQKQGGFASNTPFKAHKK